MMVLLPLLAFVLMPLLGVVGESLPQIFLVEGTETIVEPERIIDGDTFTAKVGAGIATFRIYGTDSPEKEQAWGEESRQWLEDTLFGTASISVAVEGNSYNRLLARVYADGEDVGQESIQLGHSWHYEAAKNTEAYADVQESARNQGIGLWSLPFPTVPGDFRAGRSVESSEEGTLTGQISLPLLAQAAPSGESLNSLWSEFTSGSATSKIIRCITVFGIGVFGWIYLHFWTRLWNRTWGGGSLLALGLALALILMVAAFLHLGASARLANPEITSTGVLHQFKAWGWALGIGALVIGSLLTAVSAYRDFR